MQQLPADHEMQALQRADAPVAYAGRAIVTRNGLTLLDTPQPLPTFVGQLDLRPGRYRVQLLFVPLQLGGGTDADLGEGDAICGP